MSDTPEPEETEVETQAQDAPEQENWEEQAARMGWKADFKGPNAVDAETFVTRGREILPIVQANNKALEKALEKAASRIDELEGSLKRSISTLSKAEERAYARAKSDLEGKLEQAAEIGDVAGVKDITRQITDLGKDVEPEPKKDDPLQDPGFVRAFDQWKEENAWFETDSDMADWAKGVGERLSRQGMSPREQLVEVAKRAKTTFPHKFTNPRRTEAGAVEGPSLARRNGGKSYSDLPPDAKAMCDDLVKSIKGFSREKYAKEFFGS